MNFPLLFAASLIPLLVGFIWYNPAVFGKAWMSMTGMTPEDGKKANMPLVFGLTFLFSFFIAMSLNFIVIHQWALGSIVANAQSQEATDMVNAFMAKFGNEFRTFKHGAFHGTLTGILFAFPVLAVPNMFEQKKWKLTFINAGYWVVCFALMGGVICQWM